MKRIIIVALLGLLSFAANAQCNNYGRGYGYYGRPNMRQWRHAPMAYGYRDFGPRWEFRGNRGFEGQYRGGGGWNRGRSNGQYGYNNQNNNGNAQGSGYNNQYNNGSEYGGQSSTGGRGGFRRQ